MYLLLILIFLFPILLFTLWHLTTTFIATPTATLLQNKRIILLIAHPDDESMFFSPTLQALTAPSLQNHLKILCMSTGDADGLGDTRRKELEKAALTLGVRRREDVFVMNDPRFKDGMKEQWDENEIARMLASAFAPQLNAPTPTPSPPPLSSKERERERDKESKANPKTKSRFSSKVTSKNTPPPTTTPKLPEPIGPRATIDVLITFDELGISSHPNHIALYHGARIFLTNLMRGHKGYDCPVTLYTLPTVNLVRKYSFIFDAIPTFINGVMGQKKGIKDQRDDDKVLFVNDLSKYWKAREAMTKGHESQMVWFRWGWIGMGRYMVINDLKKEAVVAT